MLLAVLFTSSVILMACGDKDDNDNNNANNNENNEEVNDQNNNEDDGADNDENNGDTGSSGLNDDENNGNNNDNDSPFGDNDNNSENDNQASEESGERVFEVKQGGAVTTLTYHHEGDVVVKQTTKSVIPYEDAGIESKDEAKEMFESQAAEYQGIDGLVEEIEYGDTEAVETLEIDYEKVDIDEISDIPGIALDENAKNGISMQKSADMLLEQGFEEK